VNEQVLLRCSCGDEFAAIVAGRDWTELANEAVASGWRFGAKDWRCSKCHQKWVASAAKRVIGRADARKEAANV